MNKYLRATLLLVISYLSFCESKFRAHHKVHNLALYPERHSWCQATPIKQEIASHDPECSPTKIDNVVCLGACFSYSVPRAQDDAVIPPYCDACRPTHSSWTVVSLNCTKVITGEHYFLPRNVEMISNCSCVDCNDNSPREESAEESSGDSGEELDNDLSKESAFNSIHAAHHHSRSFHDVNDDKDDIDYAEEDVEDGGEDSDPLPSRQVPNTAIHNLKSTSSEHKGISKDEEDLMIKDNKISPD